MYNIQSLSVQLKVLYKKSYFLTKYKNEQKVTFKKTKRYPG